MIPFLRREINSSSSLEVLLGGLLPDIFISSIIPFPLLKIQEVFGFKILNFSKNLKMAPNGPKNSSTRISALAEVISLQMFAEFQSPFSKWDHRLPPFFQ